MLRTLPVLTLVLLLNACVMQMSRHPFETLDQQIVRANFDAYKYALLNDLGKDASDLVSARTLHYYEEMLALALHGNETQVKALPAFDKMVVLTMRHTIPAADLSVLSAQDIFAYGIREEWISKHQIAPFELGNVAVFGNYATGNVVRGEHSTDRFLEFRKENDVWRLNLLPLIEDSKLQFSANIAKSQMDENTTITAMIETLSSRKVDKDIWLPAIRTLQQEPVANGKSDDSKAN